MCINMIFRTIILVSWVISCLEALKMKGNWIRWCKISFGGACGALKRKYKKKQDSRRLFSVQNFVGVYRGVYASFEEKKVYMQVCVYSSLKSGYTHWVKQSPATVQQLLSLFPTMLI